MHVIQVMPDGTRIDFGSTLYDDPDKRLQQVSQDFCSHHAGYKYETALTSRETVVYDAALQTICMFCLSEDLPLQASATP